MTQQERNRNTAIAIAVLILGLLLAAAIAFAAAGPPTADEQRMLVLINAERAKHGAPPLLWNDALGAAAREHSDDMAANGCFGHNSCNGENWATRVQRYYDGVGLYIGENVIGVCPDPECAMAGWISSPAHEANIVSDYREAGAGHADAPSGEQYWTADFGSRQGAPRPSPTPKPTPVPTATPGPQNVTLTNIHVLIRRDGSITVKGQAGKLGAFAAGPADVSVTVGAVKATGICKSRVAQTSLVCP